MNKKLIGMLIAFITFSSMAAAAPSGDYGDYALSDQVTEYTTGTDDTHAFNLSGVSDVTVDVELLNNDEVVATVNDVSVDSTGFGYATVDNVDTSVDQVAVYTEDPDNLTEATHYYNYDGTVDGESTTANYQGSQTFSSFTVEAGAAITGGIDMASIFAIVFLVVGLGIAATYN